MKKDSITRLKITYSTVKNRLLIRLLYLSNTVFRRRLTLTVLSSPGPFIFYGTPFKLHWQVKGCHKLVINDNIVLPGSITMVLVDAKLAGNNIKISFHGCSQVIERTIAVQATDAGLKQLAPACSQDAFRLSLLQSRLQRPAMPALRHGSRALPLVPVLSHSAPVMSLVRTAPFIAISRFPAINLHTFPIEHDALPLAGGHAITYNQQNQSL